jgi:hypothetical protein
LILARGCESLHRLQGGRVIDLAKVDDLHGRMLL